MRQSEAIGVLTVQIAKTEIAHFQLVLDEKNERNAFHSDSAIDDRAILTIGSTEHEIVYQSLSHHLQHKQIRASKLHLLATVLTHRANVSLARFPNRDRAKLQKPEHERADFDQTSSVPSVLRVAHDYKRIVSAERSNERAK